MNGRSFTILRERRMRRHGPRAAINLVSLMDIFTILVFFLLVNSGDVVRLPTGTSVRLPPAQAERPPQSGPALVVDEERVRLEGKTVAKIAGQAPESVAEAVAQALAPLVPEEGGAVTVLGDRAVPFRMLRAVLEGCARAGFREVLLAVQQRGAGDG